LEACSQGWPRTPHPLSRHNPRDARLCGNECHLFRAANRLPIECSQCHGHMFKYIAQARRLFIQRKAIVEPVFSRLRCQQGLNRFRRCGLKMVKREIALHVLAYNVSRAVALLVRYLPFYLLFYGLHRGPASNFWSACLDFLVGAVQLRHAPGWM
jgi:hypothetical protein